MKKLILVILAIAVFFAGMGLAQLKMETINEIEYVEFHTHNVQTVPIGDYKIEVKLTNIVSLESYILINENLLLKDSNKENIKVHCSIHGKAE